MNKQEAVKAVKERMSLLTSPKFAKLTAFVEEQRSLGRDVLWPDPTCGGLDGSLLLLALAPTVEEAEAGMASTDFLHPDFREAIVEAGIARSNLFYWSVVPWPVRNRFALDAEHPTVRTGLRLLGATVALMRNLNSVVLLGQKVQALRVDIEALLPRGSRVYDSWSVDKRAKLDQEDRLTAIQEALYAANEFALGQAAVRATPVAAKEPMYAR